MENQKKSKQEVTLSRRLSCVADMVSPGGCVCDVGCDHGFVSVYLIQKRLARYVIAADVGEGPLSRAREHVETYGLGDYIDVRLSDGLAKVTEADGVDTVIMAGMGGLLMERLIEAALHRKLCIQEYVLQPQSQWQRLRAFLRKNGYVIIQEDMIFEEGKYYPVMKVRADMTTGSSGMSDVHALTYDNDREDIDRLYDTGKTVEFDEMNDAGIMGGINGTDGLNETNISDMFGPLLLRDRNHVLRQYLLKEEKKFLEISDRLARSNRTEREVCMRLAMLRAALQVFER